MKLTNIIAAGGIILSGLGALFNICRWPFIGIGFTLLLTSLIKELFESHYGRITVESEDWIDFGTFTVTSGMILITDGGTFKSSLKVGDPIELKVRILVQINSDGSMNRMLQIRTAVHSEYQFPESIDFYTDTGLLAVLDSEVSAADSMDHIFKRSGIYNLLEERGAKIVAVLIKDDNDEQRGVVLRTGFGDGEYNLLIKRILGTELEIACDFTPPVTEA